MRPNRPAAAAVPIAALVAALVGVGALGGCGSSPKAKLVVVHTPSKEQELADLKRALNFGAISLPEYQEQAQKLAARSY